MTPLEIILLVLLIIATCMIFFCSAAMVKLLRISQDYAKLCDRYKEVNDRLFKECQAAYRKAGYTVRPVLTVVDGGKGKDKK